MCSEDVGLPQVLGMRHTDYSLGAAKMSGSALAAFPPKRDVGLALVADTVAVEAAPMPVLLVGALLIQPYSTEHC